MPREELGFSGVDYLKKKLTIQPRQPRGYGDDDRRPKRVLLWRETETEFGVPRDFFFRTATRQYELDWDVSNGHPTEYGCTLKQEGKYAEQGIAIEALLKWFSGATLTDQKSGIHMGGVLRADPAFGKTNTTYAFLHRFGRTAVVLVHKERLLRQWVTRAERYLPGVKVGVCQEDVCDFEGKDIVVAMIQSLAMERFGKRYPEEFFRWPAIVIGDEIHRVGAETWAPVPPMFYARLRLGLTATPRRNDGCDDVFWWHIGQIVFDAETRRPLPAVRMVESGLVGGPPVLRNDHVSPAIVINILARMTKRNRTIIREVVGALRSPKGRKIIVLSERLEQLRTLDEMLREACEIEGIEGVTTSFYVGEWFTGEVKLPLTKAKWTMTEETREEAIGIVYKAFRARKSLQAEEKKHRVIHVRSRAQELSEEDVWVWLDLDEEYQKAADSDGLEEFEALLISLADEYEVDMVKGEDLGDTMHGLYKAFRSRKHLEAKEIKRRRIYARPCDGVEEMWLDLDRSVELAKETDGLKEFDAMLFYLAKEHGIRQKTVEQKKALTEEQIYEAERARVMWMTYQMCSEGIDIPAADTAGYATPISDIEQAFGRIRRECVPVAHGGDRTPAECEHYCSWRANTCQGKPNPIAFDVVDDNVALSRRRRRYREQFYADVGARVRGPKS